MAMQLNTYEVSASALSTKLRRQGSPLAPPLRPTLVHEWAAPTAGWSHNRAPGSHACSVVTRAASKGPNSSKGAAPSARPPNTKRPAAGSASAAQLPLTPALPLQEPLSSLDVDAELWQVLDLCSDEELEAVYSVLHAPSPFSPVVKSLVAEKEPPLVGQRGRLSLMHKIESRFRFLAADQESLLRGARPSYRGTLLAIRDRIDVPCSTNLSTFDLETEVFLHVLNNCLEYVQGDETLGGSTGEAAARATLEHGDGMSAATSSSRPNWVERVTAPIMFGVKELIPTFAKLGSALTVTAVGRSTAAQLASQLVSSHVRYQSAVQACAAAARGATGVLGNLGRQRALEGAARGLQAATAQYSALQGALSFIGPVMWGWLALDLAFKAIGTDYARIIRAVFILAQVRLLRTHGFTNPGPSPGPSTKGPGGRGSAGADPVADAVVVTAASAVAVEAAQVVVPPPRALGPPYQQEGYTYTPPPVTPRGRARDAGDADDEDDDPYAAYNDIYN